MPAFAARLPNLTAELDAEYRDWLLDHGLGAEGDSAVDDLLYGGVDINNEQRMWLEAFNERYRAAQDQQDANLIAARWVEKIGIGFHPDTRGASYSPALPAADVRAYDADMAQMRRLGDPYLAGVAAMEAAGLVPPDARPGQSSK